MAKLDNAGGALAAGGLAALLASTCCLGPLVLVTLGFSGAWIGNLAVLEAFRPYFLAVAFVAMGFAGRAIFRPASACSPGELCAAPRVRRAYRWLFWAVALLVMVALGFPWIAPLFY
ncbi:MAG: mercuric ion transporter MerT [Gammaproteobacteria bacterium]|nr:mercuric ion transporter MerT [Gammaproteobacteria bacterium]